MTNNFIQHRLHQLSQAFPEARHEYKEFLFAEGKRSIYHCPKNKILYATSIPEDIADQNHDFNNMKDDLFYALKWCNLSKKRVTVINNMVKAKLTRKCYLLNQEIRRKFPHSTQCARADSNGNIILK